MASNLFDEQLSSLSYASNDEDEFYSIPDYSPHPTYEISQ